MLAVKLKYMSRNHEDLLDKIVAGVGILHGVSNHGVRMPNDGQAHETLEYVYKQEHSDSGEDVRQGVAVFAGVVNGAVVH